MFALIKLALKAALRKGYKNYRIFLGMLIQGKCSFWYVQANSCQISLNLHAHTKFSLYNLYSICMSPVSLTFHIKSTVNNDIKLLNLEAIWRLVNACSQVWHVHRPCSTAPIILATCNFVEQIWKNCSCCECLWMFSVRSNNSIK